MPSDFALPHAGQAKIVQEKDLDLVKPLFMSLKQSLIQSWQF